MTTFKFHPKPPEVLKEKPPARISPQRCYKCNGALKPGDRAKIHEVQPVAVCMPCVQSAVTGGAGHPELVDAVVVADEADLVGNEVPACDAGGSQDGAEGARPARE